MAATSDNNNNNIINPYEYLKDLPEKPLFTDEPIEYIKLQSNPEEAGGSHVFWIDKDAAMKFLPSVADLININEEMRNMSESSQPSCSSSLSDDVVTQTGPKVNENPLEFREASKKALEFVIFSIYHKKRYQNVVRTEIPKFRAPDDLLFCKHILVSCLDFNC